MSDISLFTDDELSGTGIGPEHGVAKTRLNALITKVNGMDTPSEFPFTPTTSSDWVDPDPTDVQGGLDDLASRVTVNDTHVAGDGSDHANVATNSIHVAGDGSDHADVATNTAAIAAIVDDHVRAAISGVTVQTDESEQSAALSGNGAYAFAPAEIVLVVTEATGTIAGDGTINIGITTDGAEILSAQALTGLDDAGDVRRIPLSEAQTAILANATLYANVESPDTTATTLVIDAHVLGRQFAF